MALNMTDLTAEREAMVKADLEREERHGVACCLSPNQSCCFATRFGAPGCEAGLPLARPRRPH